MRRLHGTLLCTLLAAVLECCCAQTTVGLVGADLCREAANCAECIQIGPECAWCAQNGFTGERCDTTANLRASNCTDLQDPVPHVIDIIKNENLSNAGDAALGQAVQVQPQEVSLKLRKGETARLDMKVRQAEDYPVDLYYVMDLSQSMKEDLDTLLGLADDLVDTLQGLTRNLELGFGSFVDKVAIPFSSFLKNGEVRIGPECIDCEEPYIFKNGLPLTNNTDLFKTTLAGTASSTSKDGPEGGFDALMQAAACKEAIGWRDSSRHIVLYASDALYHTAGDGRLGGIVTPNDGLCHLNTETGYYEFDQQMDYPSLGHLAQKIRDQSIIVMFIVTEDVEGEYRSLLPHIQGSQIGQLAADSSNILFWIERLYNRITSVVELNVDVGDELLLEFTSHCLNGVSTPNSMSCDGLTIGDTVSFSIDVTAESCVPGGTTSFTVSPVGFSEAMTVNVEIDCDCDCELGGILNSPECNRNGTFACGQCACNPGRYGDLCQCSGETATVGDDRAACMAPASNLICSGRGECVCGECVCDKQSDPTHVVSGKYCQCDNFNCPLYDGQLCGGPSRGRCECDMATQQSKCVCTSSYTGDSCNCLRSQEPCRAPNGLICNAHGTCTCGSCRCEADSPFKGATCFDCATCSGQCEVYQECVQCKAFSTGPLTEQQCSMCVAEIVIVKSFPDVSYEYNCSVPHADNCSIVFVPYFANGTADVPTLYVLEEPVCPLVVPYRVDARWVAVGLAVAIVLIGILFIIIYKCWITYLDRKEYEEWERDRKNAQFSSTINPIYKAASSMHQNPAYGQEEKEEESKKMKGNSS